MYSNSLLATGSRQATEQTVEDAYRISSPGVLVSMQTALSGASEVGTPGTGIKKRSFVYGSCLARELTPTPRNSEDLEKEVQVDGGGRSRLEIAQPDGVPLCMKAERRTVSTPSFPQPQAHTLNGRFRREAQPRKRRTSSPGRGSTVIRHGKRGRGRVVGWMMAQSVNAPTPSRRPSSRWKKSHASTTLPSGSSM